MALNTDANPTENASLHASVSDRVRLRNYWRILVKRRWLVAVVFVLSVVIVSFMTSRQQRFYRAQVSLVIESSPPQVLGQDVDDVVTLGANDFWSNREYLETQYSIIRSGAIAAQVVQQLGLQYDGEFLLRGHRRSDRPMVSASDAAGVLQSRLAVEPVKDSRMVYVRVEDPTPARAALIANTIAETYIRQNLETKLQSTVQALDWLSRQLGGLQRELEGSEMSLHTFKASNNVLSVSLEDRRNITANEIERLTQTLTDLQSRRVELSSRVDAVRRLVSSDPAAVGTLSFVESESLRELAVRLQQLLEEQSEQAGRYGAHHPRMQEIAAKIAAAQAGVDRETTGILRALESELTAARASEVGTRTLLDAASRRALELNRMEIEYNRLVREKENNEKLYALVQSRTKETDLARMLHVNNIRILDRAVRPKAPVRPNLALNAFIAVVLGLLGGLGLAFAAEYLDSTIKSQDELEAESGGVAFLGILPAMSEHAKRRSKRLAQKDQTLGRPDLLVHAQPQSSAAECCRSIRTNLLFMSPERPLRKILVTSGSPQEGKTLSVISMGTTFAQGGSRTVLVDTDMRRPRLHRAFGLTPERGLSNVIMGDSTIEEAVIPTEVPNLFVLPCGPIPPNPAELLHTQRFKDVVDELGRKYDRVILDSPPVIVVTDPVIIATLVDGVVLVVRNAKTTREVFRECLRLMSDVKARLLGTVLNDVDLESRNYGRYYYYHRRYGYYYTQSEDDESRGAAEASH